MSTASAAGPATVVRRIRARQAGGVGQRREDEYLIVSRHARRPAGRPRLDHSVPLERRVPRSLARAAEWIARHDVDAAARDRRLRHVSVTRSGIPATPGLIGLVYSRACAGGVLPTGRRIAATGDCFDALTIVVDLGRGDGRLDRRRRPGP